MSLYQDKEHEIESIGLESPNLIVLEEDLSQFLDESANFDFDARFHGRAQEKLESLGFRIPILQVERTTPPLMGSEKQFRLPITNHDIYEEVSYDEFRGILTRISDDHCQDYESIHFKIDYQAIWRGLTGTVM
jgi:hypothetical protein